jgi:hypothetical protein
MLKLAVLTFIAKLKHVRGNVYKEEPPDQPHFSLHNSQVLKRDVTTLIIGGCGFTQDPEGLPNDYS